MDNTYYNSTSNKSPIHQEQICQAIITKAPSTSNLTPRGRSLYTTPLTTSSTAQNTLTVSDKQPEAYRPVSKVLQPRAANSTRGSSEFWTGIPNCIKEIAEDLHQSWALCLAFTLAVLFLEATVLIYTGPSDSFARMSLHDRFRFL